MLCEFWLHFIQQTTDAEEMEVVCHMTAIAGTTAKYLI